MGKWQEALNHWKKWEKSIEIARADITASFGDVDALLANEKQEFESIVSGHPKPGS